MEGKYDEALVEYSKALKIRESVFGSDSVISSNSYNNVGNMLVQKNLFDEALTSYQKSLAIREAVLGSDHVKTARSYNNIANMFATKGIFQLWVTIWLRFPVLRALTSQMYL